MRQTLRRKLKNTEVEKEAPIMVDLQHFLYKDLACKQTYNKAKVVRHRPQIGVIELQGFLLRESIKKPILRLMRKACKKAVTNDQSEMKKHA